MYNFNDMAMAMAARTPEQLASGAWRAPAPTPRPNARASRAAAAERARTILSEGTSFFLRIK